MVKMLLATASTQINIDVLDFACYIANLTRSNLTGVFLKDLIDDPFPEKKLLQESPHTETMTADSIRDYSRKTIQSNRQVELFEETCKKKEVNYLVLRKTGNPLEDIIEESRFADLLIIDTETSFENERESMPDKLVTAMLMKAECPVIIAPVRFTGIDEIIFAYDGSVSAVFAIKQFTYLFPELTDKKLTILQVGLEIDTPLIETTIVGALTKAHFSRIGYQSLPGKIDHELFDYLLAKENIFIVMGASGSNPVLSAFFKRNIVDLLIKTTNLPFFIAHPLIVEK